MFFFECYGDHLDLHSFPTRRSSDLAFAHHVVAFGKGRQLAGRIRFHGLEIRGDDPAIDPEEILGVKVTRSEEHTSELQSLAYLVCRLLLEKKNACSRRARHFTT